MKTILQTSEEESSPQSSLSPADNKSKKTKLKYAYDRHKDKKPKRNKSAFIIFSTQARAKLKAEFKGNLNSNEMMIRLADLWKNLPDDERKLYEEEALKDKKRYHQELENFWKDNPFELVENKTKSNHVKKPSSAYGLYLREAKDQIKKKEPQLKMADVMKIVSEKWKTLDPKEKAVYEDRAKKEKEMSRSKLEEHYMKTDFKPENLVKKQKLRQKNVTRKKVKSEGKSNSEPTQSCLGDQNDLHTKSVNTVETAITFELPQLELNHSFSEDLTKKELITKLEQGQGQDDQSRLASLCQNVPLAEQPNGLDLETQKSIAILKSNLFPSDHQNNESNADLLQKILNEPSFAKVESILDLLNFDSNPARRESLGLFGKNSFRLNSNQFSSLFDLKSLPQTNQNQKLSRGGVLNDAIASALLSHNLNIQDDIKREEGDSKNISFDLSLDFLPK